MPVFPIAGEHRGSGPPVSVVPGNLLDFLETQPEIYKRLYCFLRRNDDSLREDLKPVLLSVMMGFIGSMSLAAAIAEASCLIVLLYLTMDWSLDRSKSDSTDEEFMHIFFELMTIVGVKN